MTTEMCINKRHCKTLTLMHCCLCVRFPL